MPGQGRYAGLEREGKRCRGCDEAMFLPLGEGEWGMKQGCTAHSMGQTELVRSWQCFLGCSGERLV